MADITFLLNALHNGNPDTAGALLAQVNADLRQLARAKKVLVHEPFGGR